MYDIAIIGGGPAGLAAGISLARQSLKTILLEKKAFPVNKACGEGIMPPGLAILKKLGAFDQISRADSLYFDGIHYFAPNQTEAQANFLEGPGLAVRRPVLSQALLDTASQTPGLLIEEKTPVLGLKFYQDTTTLKTNSSAIETRFLIGADGIRSPTRHWLGLEAPPSSLKRYGASQHYAIKPWNRKVEIHWRAGLEAYITPCGTDEIGIAFLWNKTKFEPPAIGRELADACLSNFPQLMDQLSGAKKTGPTQAIGPLNRRVKKPIAHRAALIGDAAGYLDPLTGEGISLGLKSAMFLSDYLAHQRDLSWYAKELKKSRRNYYFTTQSLLLLAKHERLFNLGVSFLGRNPRIFQRLLSLNMGPII